MYLHFSYTTTACYNYVNRYALLSYMEYPIIIVQEFMLIFLVLKYKSLFNTKTYGLCVLYFTFAFGFLSHIIPASVLTFLIVSKEVLLIYVCNICFVYHNIVWLVYCFISLCVSYLSSYYNKFLVSLVEILILSTVDMIAQASNQSSKLLL